jgi:hypothetical protein
MVFNNAPWLNVKQIWSYVLMSKKKLVFESGKLECAKPRGTFGKDVGFLPLLVPQAEPSADMRLSE